MSDTASSPHDSSNQLKILSGGAQPMILSPKPIRIGTPPSSPITKNQITQQQQNNNNVINSISSSQIMQQQHQKTPSSLFNSSKNSSFNNYHKHKESQKQKQQQQFPKLNEFQLENNNFNIQKESSIKSTENQNQKKESPTSQILFVNNYNENNKENSSNYSISSQGSPVNYNTINNKVQQVTYQQNQNQVKSDSKNFLEKLLNNIGNNKQDHNQQQQQILKLISVDQTQQQQSSLKHHSQNHHPHYYQQIQQQSTKKTLKDAFIQQKNNNIKHNQEIAQQYLHDNNQNEQLAQTKKFKCNCKKTKCLKLYCECFANGEICGAECCCSDQCCNNIANGQSLKSRSNAIENILNRDPEAFNSKFLKASQTDQNVKVHKNGCNCKKSNCLKKYCECYNAGVACSNNCKCEQCKNQQDNLHSDRQNSHLLIDMQDLQRKKIHKIEDQEDMKNLFASQQYFAQKNSKNNGNNYVMNEQQQFTTKQQYMINSQNNIQLLEDKIKQFLNKNSSSLSS